MANGGFVRRLSNTLYAMRGVVAGLPLLILPWISPAQHRWSLGLLLLLPGIALRLWSRQQIGEHTRTTHLAALHLCRRGPYSLLRHPLYLSNLLVGIGLVIMDAGAFTPILFFALYWGVLYTILARREDRWLHVRFGEFWRAWANRTPFFWPALRLPRGRNLRSLGKAFYADSWTWIWLGVILLWISWRKGVL